MGWYSLHHSLGSFLQTGGEASWNVSWSGISEKALSVYPTQLGFHTLTPRDKTETKTYGIFQRSFRHLLLWCHLASRGLQSTYSLFSRGPPLAKARFLNSVQTFWSCADWIEIERICLSVSKNWRCRTDYYFYMINRKLVSVMQTEPCGANSSLDCADKNLLNSL